jgi:hypothetical protein
MLHDDIFSYIYNISTLIFNKYVANMAIKHLEISVDTVNYKNTSLTDPPEK